MPYISVHVRPGLEPRSTMRALNVGELNFQITRLCARYVKENGLRYASINDVIGVLECAKLELYRRVAGSYEDTKRQENGDVYPEELLA